MVEWVKHRRWHVLFILHCYTFLLLLRTFFLTFLNGSCATAEGRWEGEIQDRMSMKLENQLIFLLVDVICLSIIFVWTVKCLLSLSQSIGAGASFFIEVAVLMQTCSQYANTACWCTQKQMCHLRVILSPSNLLRFNVTGCSRLLFGFMLCFLAKHNAMYSIWPRICGSPGHHTFMSWLDILLQSHCPLIR